MYAPSDILRVWLLEEGFIPSLAGKKWNHPWHKPNLGLVCYNSDLRKCLRKYLIYLIKYGQLLPKADAFYPTLIAKRIYTCQLNCFMLINQKLCK